MDSKKQITKIIQIDSDYEVTPVIDKIPDCKVTVLPFEGGKVTINGQEGEELSFAYGESLIVTVEVNYGYEFTCTYINSKRFETFSVAFDIYKDTTISVVLKELVTYNVNISSNVGVVTVNKKFYKGTFKEKYVKGIKVTLKAFDTEIYKFRNYEEGLDVSKNRQIIIPKIDRNYYFKFNYNLVKLFRFYNISCLNIKSFTLLVDGEEQVYKPQTDQQLTLRFKANQEVTIKYVEKLSKNYITPIVNVNNKIVELPYKIPQGDADVVITMDSVLKSSSSSVNLSHYAENYIKDYDTVTIFPRDTIKFLNSGLVVNNAHDIFKGMLKVKVFPKFFMDFTECKTIRGMFSYCRNAQIIDTSYIVTKSCKDFSFAFAYDQALKTIDVSAFNTALGEDFSYMFYENSSLEYLDLSKFNMRKATNYYYIFGKTDKLKYLILSDTFLNCRQDVGLSRNTTILVKPNRLNAFKNHDIFKKYAKQFDSVENYEIEETLGGIIIYKKG